MASESQPSRFGLTGRERRWLDALLTLGTFAVGLVLLGLVANILVFFGDVLLVFFLAWLLAFVLSPIANALVRAVPILPRSVAVILTYVILLVGLVLIVLVAAQSLAASVTSFATSIPQLQSRLPQILVPLQDRLRGLGLQVDLIATAQSLLSNAGTISQNLAKPLSDLAVASLGALGNLLIILFLSLFIVLDRDRILTFLLRLVPPQYAEEARLFERSVARSFGGFLRGQAIMGVIYGAVAAFAGIVLGLDYTPLAAAAAGVLQAIPFFGPFVSWAPPVVVALLTQPSAVLPALAIMFVGWFIVMNVIQPRLMAESVGIHPVVVLGSVLVGSKIAGVVGAIFSVPVAAVLSSFFFYYLNRAAAEPRGVAVRAARRVAEREGHPVRVPAPPSLTEVHWRADLEEREAEDAVEPARHVPPTAGERPGGQPGGQAGGQPPEGTDRWPGGQPSEGTDRWPGAPTGEAPPTRGPRPA